MVNVTYVSGDAGLMDRAAPLWQELNSHHLCRSPYFKDYYCGLKFEERKDSIMQRALGGDVRVDLALDPEGKPVGYCVSSVDRLQTGEIESIFVTPQFRRHGVGTALINKALDWLAVKDAKRNIVSVAVGNEEAFGFYERFGFYPRRTLLEQKKP